MGELRRLSAETAKADAEGQQHPAGMEAHCAVAEVRVAAGGLGVVLALMDIRTGKCTCFCHSRLLTWGCMPGGQTVAAHAVARCRVVAVPYGTALMTLQSLS